MDSELSTSSNKLFEDLKENFDGVECWDARVLMPHVGYGKWQDFHNAIQKAMQACRTNGEIVENLFLRTSVKFPSQRGPMPKNYKLTRRACYFVFQNGNPKVPGIAAAQAYFVRQTIRQEQDDQQRRIAEQRKRDFERLDARQKLEATEGKFNAVSAERDVTPPQVAAVRNRGDKKLFGGKSTKDMKKKLGVPNGRPLADFAATVVIKAKDLATEMTTYNAEKKDFRGYDKFGQEHEQNNKRVRDALIMRNVIPEEVPAETDIQQVKIRVGLSKGPQKAVADGQASLLEGNNNV